MNLYGLIVFHHVAQSGSVTKAAEALRISQPAVTVHVRNLSGELGLSLLAPKGRGIFLTEAGERLAAHAARLFALQDNIRRDMEGFLAGTHGELRLAATSLPANYMLPGRLAAYRALHPDVTASVKTMNAREALDALLHYEVDAAFVGGNAESTLGTKRSILLEDEMWFVAKSGHRLANRVSTIASLMNEPFIMREEGSAAREQLLTLCRLHGASYPRAALTVSGVHESLHAAASGNGVTFVSAMEAEAAVARGELIRLHAEGIVLRNPVMLFTRSDEELPPAVRRFLALFRSDSAPERMHQSAVSQAREAR